jgi:superfamily II DNA/RNA helicase
MHFPQSEPYWPLTCESYQDPGPFVAIPETRLSSRLVSFFMSTLQTRSTAPGKARRAAKGKPRHTTAQKAAARKTSDAPKSPARGTTKPAAAVTTKPKSERPTRRYTDIDPATVSKKEARNLERSKLRASRFQQTIAPKPKTEKSERTERSERSTRPERTERSPKTERPTRTDRPTKRTDSKLPSRAAKFVKDRDSRTTHEYERPVESDRRPTTRREAVKAKEARSSDGRPNFVPQKREKFIPGSKPHSTQKPPRDRRNDSPAFARDDRRASKTHSNIAVDFGADDNYISTNLADANLIDATPLTEVTTTFRDLGIAPALSNALSIQGITHPFPIQIATLPDALAGHDILGRGQTGSGKTLAFSLALLTNISGKQAKPHKPLALVLTPTRELAQQIDEVLRPLARAIGHESVVIAGGMPYAKQITAMRKATAILVATPGRLIDLLDKGEVQLDQLQITVLDEADQMADMGFLPVVKEILDQAKLDGQRLLFSATLDRGVDSLVKQYLKSPKTHSLQNDRASVSTMEHYILVMNPGDKDDITAQIAARNGKTILFVKTQRGADRLCDKLAHAGVPVGALHGGKSQAVRTRTLALFKDSANAALVATDVAARGIHVDGISLVVHVDVPQDHKDYLHRSGRTARAGESGAVVTLTTSRQQKSVSGLTSRAGVTPRSVSVTSLSTDLMRITGAQEPSGIPYVAPIVENKGPNRGTRKPRPNSAQRRRRPR